MDRRKFFLFYSQTNHSIEKDRESIQNQQSLFWLKFRTRKKYNNLIQQLAWRTKGRNRNNSAALHTF
jgi:hypothetical protein